MNANERLVWAATYAAQWSKQIEMGEKYGTSPIITTAIENAWAAVTDMRMSLGKVEDGWGVDDPVYLMLRQMVDEEA